MGTEYVQWEEVEGGESPYMASGKLPFVLDTDFEMGLILGHPVLLAVAPHPRSEGNPNKYIRSPGWPLNQMVSTSL